MKLHNLELVEIKADNKTYEYIYAVLAKSFLKKKFIKFTFSSTLPHYLWTEIQKAMIKKNIYFEDLPENKPVDIEIGSLTYSAFSEEDLDNYGNDVSGWKKLRSEAVGNQKELEREYNEQYGSPDLSNL